MNNYLKDNIRVIKDKHSEIKINEDIIREIDKRDKVEPITSYDGLMLQSNIDQSKAVEEWCKQFDDEIFYNTVVIVFGVGSFDYYAEFFKKFPDVSLVIFEPSEELFYNSLACCDYTDLLSEGLLYFCVGEENFSKLHSILRTALGADDITTPFYASIPNSIKIFHDEYEHFEEIAVGSVKTNITNRNTEMLHQVVMVENYLENLKVFVNEADVGNLRQSFSRIKGVEDYPAIILSAGPSLDKNINNIKDIGGRAFVICVDAALNTAIKNGIRPNIVVTVDPIIGPDSFRYEEGRSIPLVVQMVGSTKIREVNTGRKFYATDYDFYLNSVLKECDKSMWCLATGGSVATSAFSVAKDLGFKTIILMGQDLGYPDNKMHARDAFLDEEDANEEEDRFFYVESIDGGQVLTSYDMDEYRGWFERAIEGNPDMKVVDATEGGALIKGSEVITICEAIRKYCPTEEVDFNYYISSADHILNKDERELVKGIINKTFEYVDDKIDYLNSVKRDYYKLREVNEKKKYGTKEYNRLIRKVGKHNKYLDENRDIYLYRLLCAETHYECMEALKKIHEDKYDDVKNIVTQGLKLIDAYIEAGRKLQEMWNEISKKYK